MSVSSSASVPRLTIVATTTPVRDARRRDHERVQDPQVTGVGHDAVARRVGLDRAWRSKPAPQPDEQPATARAAAAAATEQVRRLRLRLWRVRSTAGSVASRRSAQVRSPGDEQRDGHRGGQRRRAGTASRAGCARAPVTPAPAAQPAATPSPAQAHHGGRPGAEGDDHRGRGEQDGAHRRRGRAAPSRCGSPRTPAARSASTSGTTLRKCAPVPEQRTGDHQPGRRGGVPGQAQRDEGRQQRRSSRRTGARTSTVRFSPRS